MLCLRALRERDVAILDAAARGDLAGTARLGMPPDTWWRLVRDDPRRHGWMLLDDGVEIGYLDAEEHDDAVWVAALLFPAWRGTGRLGEVMGLALAEPVFCSGVPVLAGVEPDNLAARRAVERLGFVEVGLDADGCVTYRFQAPAG